MTTPKTNRAQPQKHLEACKILRQIIKRNEQMGGERRRGRVSRIQGEMLPLCTSSTHYRSTNQNRHINKSRAIRDICKRITLRYGKFLSLTTKNCEVASKNETPLSIEWKISTFCRLERIQFRCENYGISAKNAREATQMRSANNEFTSHFRRNTRASTLISDLHKNRQHVDSLQRIENSSVMEVIKPTHHPVNHSHNRSAQRHKCERNKSMNKQDNKRHSRLILLHSLSYAILR